MRFLICFLFFQKIKEAILEVIKIMVTLQFWRGLGKECLIDVQDKAKAFKIVDIGYPFLSFVSDLEIDITSDPRNIPHMYWGLTDVQNSNTFSAKKCQSMFREIFADVRNDKALDIKMLEAAMISYGFEVPFHGIGKYDDNGTEIICDLYRCFYVQGLTGEIVEQLCVAELHYIATNGYTIKRCANCGRLFIPKKADEKYCIRRSEEYQNMNCKQAAKYKKQLAREKSNETSKTYHSINTMLARRAKMALPSKQKQEQDVLYNFRNEAAAWKELIKNNPDAEDDYISWLNSYKKRQ